MYKSFFFLSIFLFSSLNTGWANCWNSITHGFKSIFSYQYAMDQINQQRPQWASEGLKSASEHVKANWEEEIKERRKTANEVIVEEIEKTGISEFFTLSKPTFSTVGIFNTSEAAFLIQQVQSKINAAKKKQSDETTNEGTARPSTSEKCPRIIDSRDLPHLGKYEHNNNMSRFLIYFSVFATNNNHAKIQISLIERILATKRMQNRESGLIEDVPVSKKQARIIIIGTENDNGSFSWEKITNDITPQDATPKEARKVAFNDAANKTNSFARWNYSETATRSNK